MLFNIVASFSPIQVYKSPFNCNKKESINHLGKNYALSGSEAQTMVLDLLNTVYINKNVPLGFINFICILSSCIHFLMIDFRSSAI